MLCSFERILTQDKSRYDIVNHVTAMFGSMPSQLTFTLDRISWLGLFYFPNFPCQKAWSLSSAFACYKTLTLECPSKNAK